MREALALVRASWLSAVSYRLSMAFSLAGLVAIVVPVYFVARALQPLLAEAIATEGGQYFAFVLIGMITLNYLADAVHALPGAIRSGVNTGTLEALLSTPARLPSLLGGMTAYDFIWTSIRSVVFLLAGWVLGAQYAWDSVLGAVGILFLIVLSYLPFGLLTAAMVLAFRTSGPLPRLVLLLSGLLGGVYYPTTVIPSWLQYVSDAIPLTYGLRALRQVFLEGIPLAAVATDVAILAAFTAVLLAVGVWAFSAALRYARRTGTLAQY
ncbi:MAG TPA: ABC transporter permease [Longimicrobiaceae bacterium]|nr:ABC transporter permease [Longimicrobiaceae bacterium]